MSEMIPSPQRAHSYGGGTALSRTRQRKERQPARVEKQAEK